MSHDPTRIFDEFAKIMTDASGAAQSMRREFETAFKAQGERMAAELGFVSREAHDAVHDMAVRALDRLDVLETRVKALEDRLAAAPKEPAAKKSADKKQAAARKHPVKAKSSP